MWTTSVDNPSTAADFSSELPRSSLPPILSNLPMAGGIDHMGMVMVKGGIDEPGLTALLDLRTMEWAPFDRLSEF
jgi:hypothetical protein